jgi:hypothetical protein
MACHYPVRSPTRTGVQQGRALLGPTPVPPPAQAGEGGALERDGTGLGLPAKSSLADNLSLFCPASQLRSFSSFSQNLVFLARIPRLRRSLGAYLEFVLSSFSKRDPVLSMT